MEVMARYPDKFFDLAIVDPPYGLGRRLLIGRFKKDKNGAKWDVRPKPEYFTELFRVSRHQIIFGGNYFNLGPCRGFIIWDKIQPAPSFSACEFAWTSFDTVSKIFRHRQAGGNNEVKIHPTQKPVDLYRWLLHNYGLPGDRILDTHLGSQSSRIAAYEMGFDFYGCELDPRYFAEGCARFQQHISQLPLF